jgi:hypothetical protein
MPSFKVELIADTTGEWYGNQPRFATAEEAELYASDISSRWTSVRQSRVVPDEQPANYVWRGRAIELDNQSRSEVSSEQ